jgi:hypothetical protein
VSRCNGEQQPSLPAAAQPGGLVAPFKREPPPGGFRLPCSRSERGASALSDLLYRRGLERAGEALNAWAAADRSGFAWPGCHFPSMSARWRARGERGPKCDLSGKGSETLWFLPLNIPAVSANAVGRLLALCTKGGSGARGRE